ncbi:MAG: vWA domain-containing protein [Spirochaetales bacterium]
MKASWFRSVFLALFTASAVWAQVPEGLTLKAGDVRIESRDDGFHLIIRQTTGLSSVMLVESYELPDHKLATYSWKSVGDYPSGANEKRLLNGVPLKAPNSFLVSSTVVADPRFGASFEVVIPTLIEYGSTTAPGARYGKLNVSQELAKAGGKVWFSIRTFAKPYEDYTGAYKDNAFELSTLTVVAELPPDHGKYVKGAEDLFRRLGPTEKALDPADGVKRLTATLRDNVDLVWAIDTTKSMKQDLAAVRETLAPQIEALTEGLAGLRLGFVFYRDYQELYLTKTVKLTSDRSVWKSELLGASADAGGDVPEAAIEALSAALDVVAPAGSKAANPRQVVVFADAAQHDVARGKLGETATLARVNEAGVTLQFILLPLTTF